ncbi:MAG: DUF6245 family protein [Pseudonocardiaceae bacterium]
MISSGVREDPTAGVEHSAGVMSALDRLVEEVLGGVQLEAVLGELVTAGVAEDSVEVMEFLRWLSLRVGGPLQEITRSEQIGPMPLAAAHVADGLQRLLGVCSTGQDLNAMVAGSVPAELDVVRDALRAAIIAIDGVPAELAAARATLSAAIIKVDVVCNLESRARGASL